MQIFQRWLLSALSAHLPYSSLQRFFHFHGYQKIIRRLLYFWCALLERRDMLSIDRGKR